MTQDERKLLADLIDITIANSVMISDLRRNNKAMRLFIEKVHPAEYQKRFAGFWADADGRGAPVYESRLAAVRKLAEGRDSLHKADTEVES
jgi:hypothetical protein